MLINELERIFLLNADEFHAQRKTAYMRHLFPFIGLLTPLRKTLQQPLFKTYAIHDERHLKGILGELWDKEQREFQYAALDLAASFRKLSSFQTLEAYEGMIRQKSWWDTVDDIAANLVGPLVSDHPNLLEVMDQWIQDENLWIRRTALIFQLKWKKQTDTRRLFSYCSQLMHERDFFIRKAIGWALRQYSKTDPRAVEQFIRNNQLKLSPLSIKEGSKYISQADLLLNI
jgi:3-methyladenine DNA glycosylase AlkD